MSCRCSGACSRARLCGVCPPSQLLIVDDHTVRCRLCQAGVSGVSAAGLRPPCTMQNHSKPRSSSSSTWCPTRLHDSAPIAHRPSGQQAAPSRNVRTTLQQYRRRRGRATGLADRVRGKLEHGFGHVLRADEQLNAAAWEGHPTCRTKAWSSPVVCRSFLQHREVDRVEGEEETAILLRDRSRLKLESNQSVRPEELDRHALAGPMLPGRSQCTMVIAQILNVDTAVAY